MVDRGSQGFQPHASHEYAQWCGYKISTNFHSVLHSITAPLPPSGFHVVGQRINSMGKPVMTLKWDSHQGTAHSRPQNYELLVYSERILVWHDVTSPLDLMVPTYILSNTTLIAANCIGSRSTSMLIHAGEWWDIQQDNIPATLQVNCDANLVMGDCNLMTTLYPSNFL